MRTVDLFRHTDNDGDALTPDGIRATVAEIGIYNISSEVTYGDGKTSIEADLLPLSVTVLTFDRGA